MDFNKLIARVKAILMTPRTEWPVIAAEATTAGDIYKNYIVWLAGVSAVANFLSLSLIGLLGAYRMGIVTGLTVLSFAMSLVFTWLFAWLIDALAPTFGGHKNRVQALKAAAYSFTAGWVASIAVVVPVLGGLIALAGLIYGIYLLYVGLPQTMKCPQEKSAVYTAVTIIIALVAGIVIWSVVARVAFPGGGMGMGGLGGLSGMMNDGGKFDSASAGGRLGQLAKSMEEAGKRA